MPAVNQPAAFYEHEARNSGFTETRYRTALIAGQMYGFTKKEDGVR